MTKPQIGDVWYNSLHDLHVLIFDVEDCEGIRYMCLTLEENEYRYWRFDFSCMWEMVA